MLLCVKNLSRLCKKNSVVQFDSGRVIFHYKSSKFEEMFVMYIKYSILDKNHTELDVQCCGCVPTYHLKRLILSSDVFIFIDCILVHIYVCQIAQSV